MGAKKDRPDGEGAPRLDPFSQAVQAKKEQLYDKVKLSVKQLDVIVWLAAAALVVVVVLIILEATDIFKLF
ncbi:MAG: hypothetical protein IJJ45_02935 [Clostridia bacterium]|nr:hypothetical protein [Clostridia bacterium]